jgi:hypothetical protein
MADYSYVLSTFTAGEAEAITGVTTQVQRDWRRRGYLPATDGHARHDVFALAELLALKALGDRGIGPQEAKKSAPLIAAGIAAHAIGDPRAIAGAPPDLTCDGAASVAARIFRDRFGRVFPPPYFIIWADGHHDWVPDLRHIDAHGMASTLAGEKIVGAIIVIPIVPLGDVLRRRASRPLVTVSPLQRPSPKRRPKK